MKYIDIDVKNDNSLDYVNLKAMIIDYSDGVYNNERPLVIICPGGGYGHLSDRESEFIAYQFLAAGYHAAVLKYSVAPATYPTALLELAKAVKEIRKNAEDWHIIPDKIVVMGFSAGGHLAASFAEFWEQDFVSKTIGCDKELLRPNGLILGYPVISAGEFAHKGSFDNLLGNEKSYNEDKEREALSLEKHVTDSVPRTFIWGTFADETVPVMNSVLFVNALAANNIPVEYHLFEKGNHGTALSNEITCSKKCVENVPENSCWVSMCMNWMKNL